MEIRKINVVQYFFLNEEERVEYDFAIKYSVQAEKRDVLNFGDITKKKFGEVKDLQYLFTEKDLLIKFAEKFDIANSLDVFEFFAFFKYIEAEVIRVCEIEHNLLSHENTSLEISAGIEKFNKFGVIIQIDNLAKGDVLKWQQIRELNYEDCLVKLVLDKTTSDYQRDFQNIYLNSKRN